MFNRRKYSQRQKKKKKSATYTAYVENTPDKTFFRTRDPPLHSKQQSGETSLHDITSEPDDTDSDKTSPSEKTHPPPE